MNIDIIANYIDLGIIVAILLITEFIKDRLHKTKLDSEMVDYKIMPFIPLVLGIFGGISVVMKNPQANKTFWEIVWQSIKYAGAATFVYKLWSRFGRDSIIKLIRKKLDDVEED